MIKLKRPRYQKYLDNEGNLKKDAPEWAKKEYEKDQEEYYEWVRLSMGLDDKKTTKKTK